MKTVVVSGSIAAGKTIIAKKLAKLLKADYVNITDFVKKKRLGKYSKKYKSYDVNINKLNNLLIRIIKKSKKNLVIDGHLSHYLPRKYIDLCIICKCDIKILKKRLEKRNYSKQKIRENLDVEIFDIPLVEAQKKGYNIYVIDTSKKYNLNSIKKLLSKSSLS